LIWPQFVATAMSAMVVSSVSLQRRQKNRDAGQNGRC